MRISSRHNSTTWKLSIYLPLLSRDVWALFTIIHQWYCCTSSGVYLETWRRGGGGEKISRSLLDGDQMCKQFTTKNWRLFFSQYPFFTFSPHYEKISAPRGVVVGTPPLNTPLCTSHWIITIAFINFLCALDLWILVELHCVNRALTVAQPF